MTDRSFNRTWIITGCSTGIGRALCERVLLTDDRLVATGRNVAALESLVADHPEKAIALKLDVCDPKSVKDAVSRAIEWAGCIDVCVNNAGYGVVGAVEEVEEAEVRRAFDTNFFGAYRVIRAVLPHMRKRRTGHILNVSSALGLFARGGYTIYSATKFALEGLSEGLAQEVAPFGIKVTLLEPGSFRTDFRHGTSMYAAPVAEAYRESLAAFRSNLEKGDGKQPGDPHRGAEAILAIVNEDRPPLRFPMGKATIDHTLQKLDSIRTEIDAWSKLSLSTSFPE